MAIVQSGSLEGSFSFSVCHCIAEFLLELATFLFLASLGGNPSEGGGLVDFLDLGAALGAEFSVKVSFS